MNVLYQQYYNNGCCFTFQLQYHLAYIMNISTSTAVQGKHNTLFHTHHISYIHYSFFWALSTNYSVAVNTVSSSSSMEIYTSTAIQGQQNTKLHTHSYPICKCIITLSFEHYLQPILFLQLQLLLYLLVLPWKCILVLLCKVSMRA